MYLHPPELQPEEIHVPLNKQNIACIPDRVDADVDPCDSKYDEYWLSKPCILVLALPRRPNHQTDHIRAIEVSTSSGIMDGSSLLHDGFCVGHGAHLIGCCLLSCHGNMDGKGAGRLCTSVMLKSSEKEQPRFQAPGRFFNEITVRYSEQHFSGRYWLLGC
jgi:hypothetical protein